MESLQTNHFENLSNFYPFIGAILLFLGMNVLKFEEKQDNE